MIFLFDTSFGTERVAFGRNYRWASNDPGGQAAAASFLDAFHIEQRRWSVLFAASPTQVALELHEGRMGRGAFTYFLLRALSAKTHPALGQLGETLREQVGHAVRGMFPGREQTPSTRAFNANSPLLGFTAGE